MSYTQVRNVIETITLGWEIILATWTIGLVGWNIWLIIASKVHSTRSEQLRKDQMRWAQWVKDNMGGRN